MGLFTELREALSSWDNLRTAAARVVGGEPLREVFAEFSGVEGRDRDEHLFRQIDGVRLPRDLDDFRRIRTQKIAYWLYLAYPLAKRGLEIVKDFVVGDGLGFKAVDPSVHKVLNDFWTDSVNGWNLKQGRRVVELGMLGEQFYPMFVNEENGHVRMGTLDPLAVTGVETDPENAEAQLRVISQTGAGYAGLGAGAKAGGKRVWEIVHLDEDPESKTFGRRVGQIMVFQINRASNASRGISDLFPVVDWLETHESFLMNMHEAAHQKTKVWADVTAKGASGRRLKKLEQTFANIKAGSVRVHNESVSVTMQSPNLGTSELGEHAAILKRHIAAGLGIPETWLSESGNANRATAAEMGVPSTRMLRSRQAFVVSMLSEIFEFVIDQALIFGSLEKDVDRRFRVVAPQVWALDTQKITASLLTAAQAIAVAEERGWATDQEARELWWSVADQLGVRGVTPMPPIELKRVHAERDAARSALEVFMSPHELEAGENGAREYANWEAKDSRSA